MKVHIVETSRNPLIDQMKQRICNFMIEVEAIRFQHSLGGIMPILNKIVTIPFQT